MENSVCFNFSERKSWNELDRSICSVELDLIVFVVKAIYGARMFLIIFCPELNCVLPLTFFLLKSGRHLVSYKV